MICLVSDYDEFTGTVEPKLLGTQANCKLISYIYVLFVKAMLQK